MQTQPRNITPLNNSVATGRRATENLDVYVTQMIQLARTLDKISGETNDDILRRSTRTDCLAVHVLLHTAIGDRITKFTDNKQYKRTHMSLIAYVRNKSTSLCKNCTARDLKNCAHRQINNVFLDVVSKSSTTLQKNVLQYAEHLYILHLFFGDDKAFFLTPRATVAEALVARYTRCKYPCVTLNVAYDASRLSKFGRKVYDLMVMYTNSGDNVADALPVIAEGSETTPIETRDQSRARPCKRVRFADNDTRPSESVHLADAETRTPQNTASVATTMAGDARSEFLDDFLDRKLDDLFARKFSVVVETCIARLHHHMRTADCVTQQETLDLANANACALIKRSLEGLAPGRGL
ncbi:hypothetical protein CYMTET_40203 [Cymbomonas tetramitiformis]|uniref:Uncharacterized protein n=1 Tax=Cymbomonas tetramitiformis TaxID=36881 RepID=A0AAE0CAN2_9CHLO|nr:hypothetical protein CYMTET_40203 [Cymbomonas tetramitiformis]